MIAAYFGTSPGTKTMFSLWTSPRKGRWWCLATRTRLLFGLLTQAPSSRGFLASVARLLRRSSLVQILLRRRLKQKSVCSGWGGGEEIAMCENDDKVAALATSRAPTTGEFFIACGCYDAHVVLWLMVKIAARKAAASSYDVRLVDRFSGGDQDVRAVHLTQSGTVLVCGSDDSTLRVWTGSRNGPTMPMYTSAVGAVHKDWIHAVFASENGSLIATGSDDCSMTIFDTVAQKVVGRERIFSGAFSVALTPGPSLLFSASGDLRVWSVPKMLRNYQDTLSADQHAEGVTGLDVSRDGRSAASVSPHLNEDGRCDGLDIKTWNSDTGRSVSSFSIPGSAADDDRPLCLCLSPDASIAAIGADTGKLWVVSLKEQTSDPLWVLDEAHSERVTCCQWMDEDVFATGSEDGFVCVWSVTGKNCVVKGHVNEDGVLCLAMTRDRKHVLTGENHDCAKWSELKSGRCLYKLDDAVRTESSVKTACDVALTADESRAVTCSWDKALRVWDLVACRLLLVVAHVSEWVTKGFGATLAGCEEGLCVSHAWDRQLHVWDFTELLCTQSPGKSGGPIIVESESAACVWRLATCQCDASLVKMAASKKWPKFGAPSVVGAGGDVRRTLAIADEDGRVHFFEVSGTGSR
eukprot:TRINITY_DN37692_c0_g2_i1.p1 TRINITY_DN37692_c0_g2~~TRINITY_DN37692_c0_g2_i1.p1  ORF type:complete len:636 (-),score=83.35 TRINITY_DN37692_c0_g2_i1:117-2024(-)